MIFMNLLALMSLVFIFRGITLAMYMKHMGHQKECAIGTAISIAYTINFIGTLLMLFEASDRKIVGTELLLHHYFFIGVSIIQMLVAHFVIAFSYDRTIIKTRNRT